MSLATRRYGLRLTGFLVLLILLSSAVIALNIVAKTGHLIASLPDTKVEKLPEVLQQLAAYPSWVYSGRLREHAARQGHDRARGLDSAWRYSRKTMSRLIIWLSDC